ncbi:MAG: hypothetical protein JKY89_03695 [Immundisolibacteraceae bacterium]|nr:hypothetical protein [Immundisolibacteraceae bacterium]
MDKITTSPLHRFIELLQHVQMSKPDVPLFQSIAIPLGTNNGSFETYTELNLLLNQCNNQINHINSTSVKTPIKKIFDQSIGFINPASLSQQSKRFSDHIKTKNLIEFLNAYLNILIEHNHCDSYMITKDDELLKELNLLKKSVEKILDEDLKSILLNYIDSMVKSINDYNNCNLDIAYKGITSVVGDYSSIHKDILDKTDDINVEKIKNMTVKIGTTVNTARIIQLCGNFALEGTKTIIDYTSHFFSS